jgi:hypothetical protein
LRVGDQIRRPSGKLHVLSLRQAADRNGPDDLAFGPDGDTAAPPGEVRVAEVADIETFLWMSGSVADAFAGFTLARGGISFVDGDRDRGERRSIHPGERDEFTVLVRNCDNACLATLLNFGRERIYGSPRFGVFDGLLLDHILMVTTRNLRRLPKLEAPSMSPCAQ